MKYYTASFCLIVSLCLTLSVSATTLRPITLQQLSTRAPLIFYGEVISNHVQQDAQSGHVATFTSFKVIEPIKGISGKTHTIKQIGGQLQGSNIQLHIPGVPEFSIGKSYVVFLPEKSRLGFSSPLGLHQGTFTVETIDGEKIISNGSNLATSATAAKSSVQLPLAVDVHKPAQSRLYDFIDTVRAYNAP